MSERDPDEVRDFKEWKLLVEKMLPWPDTGEIIEAIGTCGIDHPKERILLLRRLVEGHYNALDMGAFNDE